MRKSFGVNELRCQKANSAALEIGQLDDDGTAAQLLATKLLVPVAGPEVVPRPRLVKRFHEATRRNVTLVAAPAGFGKTTSVAAFFAATKSLVAWLTMDEDDNILGRFLVHFVGAIRCSYPEVGGMALSQFARTPLLPKAVLGALINDLAARSAALTLVLDNFEVVRSQEVLEAVSFLLDHQPPNLHLVLCSREQPRLPLSRLRARGQLSEITVDDLRFTAEESAQFLEQALALPLSAQGLRRLHERTEGWVAGLQLAALSLLRSDDRDHFIAHFSGDHRHVADYLLHEVLHRVSPEIKQFLLATSVLRTLSGDLCDSVTGGCGGKVMLEQLAADNLFVQPLDDQRRWYRYHGLFGELLRYRLAVRDPDATPRLHRRAASWFARRGVVVEVIHHALAGGYTSLATRLVQRHGYALLARGELRAVLGWLAALPEEAFVKHAELGTLEAWALLGARDIDGAARCLAAVEERHGKLPSPRLVSVLRVLAEAVCHFRNEPDDTLALTAQVEAAALPAAFAGMLELLGALAHHARGDLRQARCYAELGLASELAQESPLTVIHLKTLLARLDLREGRLHSAESRCRNMLELARKNGWWELSYRTAPQLALAEVLYERGALLEAEEVLASAAELARRLGPDEYEDLAAVWLVRVRLARGQSAPSGEAELERSRRESLSIRLFGSLAYHRLCWRLAAGEAAEVEAELRRGGLDPRSTVLDPRWEAEYLLLARALIVRGQAPEALPLLSRLHSAAHADGRRTLCVKVA